MVFTKIKCNRYLGIKFTIVTFLKLNDLNEKFELQKKNIWILIWIIHSCVLTRS